MLQVLLVLLLFSVPVVPGKENSTIYENRLSKFRERMKIHGLDAYIIPNEGEHQEEIPAKHDLRREYLSGFSGSSGDAVVTMDKALLWTDTRYYLQAEKQLGPSWTLIRKNDPQVDTIEVWLYKNLKNDQKVGADPKTISYSSWDQINKYLSSKRIKFLPLDNNLVDDIWEDRPERSNEAIFVHDYQFSGEHYTDKMKKLRVKMESLNTDLFIMSALDEIAWLLNLRGNDTLWTPVFLSYALIGPKWAKLYIHEEKITKTIKEYLSDPKSPVEILSYSNFWDDLKKAIDASRNVYLTTGTDGTSYAIFNKVPKDKVISGSSPVKDMKAYKNRNEVQGSRNAHLRDAVALCELFRLLEIQVPNDIYWDELKVSKKLDELRSAQKWNKGSSFQAIVAFGKNGALPHYHPTPESNLQITTEGLLTIDSGGQYLDGTVDTTRVLHFGTPSDKQKTIYTSLLQGVADLGSTIFPDGTTASALEFIIRRPLVQLGLTFGHGTTHGTGSFLGVHEAYNGIYHHHFIGSQEPGYYKADEFGMRLENLIVVEDANVQNKDNPYKLLQFSPLTLVPYESRLIEAARMDKSQIKWLNEYHKNVRLHVGTEMVRQSKLDLYTWLVNKTAPIYSSDYSEKCE